MAEGRKLKEGHYTARQLFTSLLGDDGLADSASLTDFVTYGIYYSYCESAVGTDAKKYKASFNDFPRYFLDELEGLDRTRQKLSGDDMSALFDRIERHFGVFLVPRTYGKGRQNGGDVPLNGGKVDSSVVKRDPSRFTRAGHAIGRWAQIVHLMMKLPGQMKDPDEHLLFIEQFHHRLRGECEAVIQATAERRNARKLKLQDEADRERARLEKEEDELSEWMLATGQDSEPDPHWEDRPSASFKRGRLFPRGVV